MHSEKRKMLLEAIANVSENEKILAKDTVGRKQKKISSPNSPVWHISYNGRVHRAAFFLMIILFISKTVISKELLARFEIGSAAIPLAIIEIIFLAWAISISIRRLHDINRSWWWTVCVVPWLISMIGYAQIWAETASVITSLGAIASLVLLFKEWDNKDNQYWQVPQHY